MAKINFGGTVEDVVTRDEFSLDKAREVLKNFPKSVSISAIEGTGIKDLLHLMREELFESYSPIHVRLPYKQGALISLFHELGQVEIVEHERGGMVMRGRIPGRLLAQFAPWHVTKGQVKQTSD